MEEGSSTSSSNSSTITITQQNIADMISIISYILCAIAICFGNSLVLISIWKFQKLQTISNVFVASLALTDLTIGLCVLPLRIVKLIRRLLSFEDLAFLSHTAYTVHTLAFSSSLLILLLIAAERHTAIVYPYFYIANVTIKKAILSTVVAVLANLSYQISLNVMHGRQSEDENAPPGFLDEMRDAIIIVILVACKTSLYINIALIARRQKRLIAVQTAHVKKTDHKPVKQESKTTKMLATILGTVYICWIPYLIHECISENLDDNIVENLYWLKLLGTFSDILRCVNSMLNPMIYAGMSSDFRFAFLQLLKLRKTDTF